MATKYSKQKMACRIVTQAFLMLMMGLVAIEGSADIYKYIGKDGRVILTDRPKHDGYTRLVKTWKGWHEQKPTWDADWKKKQKKYDPLIRRLAKAYDIPYTLLHAIITAESAYNAEAVSRAGAVGLMQLMPGTARRYGVSNREEPIENLRGGTRYFHDLLKMFNNDVRLALAAYNAGENTVRRYGNAIPPYKETQDYVKKVMQYYRQYRKTMV